MKSAIETITQQIQRNAVALISLVIALSSLGYNTWRNETTEQQRNLRHAAFELVEELGELQANTSQLAFYGEEGNDTAWNRGWANVLSIRTLGQLMPDDVPARTERLYQSWSEKVGDLDSADPETREAADQVIFGQVLSTNEAVISVLRSLD